MKTYNVGGLNPVRRCKTLAEALKKAQDDDTIVLHKNLQETAIIDKNIILQGNNHTISVDNGKAAIKTTSPCEIHDLKFSVSTRANAIVIGANILLDKITATLNGPVRAFYPLVMNNAPAKITIKDSDLMSVSLNDSAISTIDNTIFRDYYPGDVVLQTRDNMSQIRGTATLNNCTLHSIIFNGDITLNDCTLDRYIDIDGHLDENGNVLNDRTVTFNNAVVKTQTEDVKHNPYKKEPESGPLQHRIDSKYVLALYRGSKVVINGIHYEQTNPDFLGIYAVGSSLIYQNVNLDDQGIKNHLIDTNLSLKNTHDKNFWNLDGNTTAAYIKSEINANRKHKTAMQKLDEMIGQQNVKNKIHSIMHTITENNGTTNKDFKFSYHMIFAGSPGTGKSTIGEIVGEALYEIGAIPENKFTLVEAADLIKGYVGQTGEHTREVLDSALGGVLFIDEAYQLTVKPDGGNSFNSDAITPIVEYMDKYRDRLVVIAAGYSKEMKEFLASNIGFNRRFQWVQFDDYTNKELAEIFEMIRKSYGDTYADPKVADLIEPLFAKTTQVNLSIPDANGRRTNGGNGGLARNVYQNVISARSDRLATTNSTDRAITQNDVLIGFKMEIEKAENRKL